MKKLILITGIFLCVINSFAQTFPNTTTQGNAATKTVFPGAPSGPIQLRRFADTITLNLQPYLKFTPNLMVAVGDDVYIRNTTAMAWILIGSNANSGQQSYIVPGTYLIYDSLFKFRTLIIPYYILGRYFTAPATAFTLSATNPSAARIDKIYVDTLSQAGVLQGANGSPPVAPSVNPSSQLEVGLIELPADSTHPANFSNGDIYRDGVTVFTGSTAIAGASFVYTGVTAYEGIYSTNIPAYTNGQSLTYTRSSDTTLLNGTILKFRIRLSAAMASGNLTFTFSKAGNPISNSIVLSNGLFGYNSATVGSWMEGNVSLANFQFSSYDYDELVIGLTGSSATAFQLDFIRVQYGGSSSGGGVIKYNLRDGFVTSQQSDDQWGFQGVRLNYDSSRIIFTNNAADKDSVATLYKGLYSDSCFTITDTTIGGRLAVYITFNQNCGGSGGGGTVSNVTGTSPIVITGTSTVTPNVTINNAAADGSTKGAASFTANDFNSSSGNISIDYTNGQSANGSTKGFLTAADWTTFNSKQATITTTDSILVYSASNAFTFPSVPSTYSDYLVFRNNSLLESTTDYTTSGNVITLLLYDLTAGDKIRFHRTK